MNKVHFPQMMKCGFCGKQLAANAKSCPNCGGETKNKTNTVQLLIVIFAIGTTFLLILFPELREYLESIDPLKKNGN